MTPGSDTTAPCPACRHPAEPEQDGDLTYHDCGTCGYIFGFTRITPTLSAENSNTCAVGVPEAIRRAASAPAEATLAGNRALPLLTIGMRSDATA